MKKIWLISILMISASAACIKQTIHHDMTFLDNHGFEEVWVASIRAVNDIDFTVRSLDIDDGFIAAESGRHIGQNVPPQISIFITEAQGRIFVECKVLQKEQYVDILGHGRRTIRRFMTSLNYNLNHRH